MVVEGAELLSVALGAGLPVESVFVAPEARRSPGVGAAVDRAFATGARVFDLAPGVLERIADTVSPQPLVAVVGFAPGGSAELGDASLVVVLADVRDPGNAGTIIRTADAVGADAVLCCEGTVDPTNSKCIRASAGSLFHLPVLLGGAAADELAALRRRGLATVGAVVRGGVEYSSFDWCRPVGLVFGNEASGLGPDLIGALDAGVSIPMEGRAESLNVGVAAAVLCFEILRQRRAAGSDPAPPGDGVRRSTMPGMRSEADGSDEAGKWQTT